MNYRHYEKIQLLEIVQSYAARGFKVSYETAITIGGRKYWFDAVAENDSGELFIIELVNKRLGTEAMQKRLAALAEVAALRPEAKVDFRYIDADVGTLQLAQRRPQEADPLELQHALTARLPRLAPERPDSTRQFLDLWLLHVSTIRAHGVNLGLNQAMTESILDLYNEMLRTRILVAPENALDVVNQDLFDLYDKAQGALQGAAIDQDTFLQLRGHVLEIRRQIRKY